MPEADITRAQFFAEDLLRWESRGPGDTANAMRRVAQRAALPFSKVWSLRYRPPKAVASHVLAALAAAHAAEKERQMRKLAHDLETTARVSGAADPAVVAAAALLRAHAPDLVSPELVAAVVDADRERLTAVPVRRGL